MTTGGRPGPYATVAQELSGTAFGSIEYVEETDSTNADAAALLGDDRFGGYTIVAEYQRHGLGRKGRSWQAQPGTALLFSTILPRALPTETLWLVQYWVALALRNALHRCGVTTLLQWPNDVLLGPRKLAGVLCQSAVTGPSARVACGVGDGGDLERPRARRGWDEGAGPVPDAGVDDGDQVPFADRG